jgi:hypothetical protein
MHSTIHEIHSALAIRYLGAILELPSFWQLSSSIPNQHMVQKLLQRAITLIQDLGIEHEDTSDPALEDVLDNEGIDYLIHAMLKGIEEYMQKNGPRYLVDQLWWNDLLGVLKLLVK